MLRYYNHLVTAPIPKPKTLNTRLVLVLYAKNTLKMSTRTSNSILWSKNKNKTSKCVYDRSSCHVKWTRARNRYYIILRTQTPYVSDRLALYCTLIIIIVPCYSCCIHYWVGKSNYIEVEIKIQKYSCLCDAPRNGWTIFEDHLMYSVSRLKYYTACISYSECWAGLTSFYAVYTFWNPNILFKSWLI